MNRTVRLVILGVMAAVILATLVLSILYVRYGREIVRKTEDGQPATYTLGVFEGKLAVYKGGAAFPMKLYEVAIASLPATEQQRLQAGISVQTVDELQRLLEDYTS